MQESVGSENTVEPEEEKHPRNNKLLFLALLFVGALAAALFLGIYLGRSYFAPKLLLPSASTVPISAPSNLPTTSVAPTFFPSLSPSSSLGLHLDWETFTTEDGKITFKYPPNWSIDTTKKVNNILLLALTDGDEGVFTLRVAPEDMGLLCVKTISGGEIYLDGIKSYKNVIQTLTGDECGHTEDRESSWLNFTYNGQKYLLVYYYPVTNEIKKREQFDQILSTFQFLD